MTKAIKLETKYKLAYTALLKLSQACTGFMNTTKAPTTKQLSSAFDVLDKLKEAPTKD